ncbi:PAS domain S-box protein [Phenylobacterium sp.]|uniref:PAS domain-containing protein n=1 Tax=Phenylobacterium sp. TaxID=1871053 RepID=UPI0025DD8A44|nr:PAS domain S-box protein [Phenylobacterium sp.]
MPDVHRDLDPSSATPIDPPKAPVASGGADDLVVRADSRGVILYVSESCRNLGYEPQELIGRLGADFVHPDDLTGFAANSARLFVPDVGDERVRREFRYLRKDGSWAWLEGHPTILPASDGRLGDVLNVFCDVTDRRAMRDHLRAQAHLARAPQA